MPNEIALWTGGGSISIPSTAKKPSEIVEYAVQLPVKDQKSIALNFENESYEIAISFVWQKSMSALKKELATVGMKFLGEILEKPDLDDDAKPTSVISDVEAIMLAEELGVVNTTDAIRLRHAHELITHFIDKDGAPIDGDPEEMEEAEALQTLKTCVKNILGKEKVKVSTEFASFRQALSSKSLKETDGEVQKLILSPYFFKKITVKIILGIAKTHKGAQLENALANVNVILPAIWTKLRDPERYSVGSAYAEAYDAGEQTISAGLKRALLKVHGFDYVPENLRSQAFIKTATKLIEAHEGYNNFYNEPAPTNELRALGTTIPIHAFAQCATALLCVVLGNPYGVSNAASAIARQMLDAFTKDRWEFYIDKCLPSDVRILHKLSYEGPKKRFISLVQGFNLSSLNSSGLAKKLVEAAKSNDAKRISDVSAQMLQAHYAKQS